MEENMIDDTKVALSDYLRLNEEFIQKEKLLEDKIKVDIDTFSIIERTFQRTKKRDLYYLKILLLIDLKKNMRNLTYFVIIL